MSEEHFRSRAISYRYVITGSVLLCVVAVIAAGYYDYWDHYLAEERAKAEGRTATMCMVNIRGITAGLHNYAKENRKNFPPDEGELWTVLPRKTKDLRCPVSRLRRSYTYVAGLRADDPKDYILLFENKCPHGPWSGITGVIWTCGRKLKFNISEAEIERRIETQRKELEKKGRRMELIPIDSSRGRL